MYSNSWIQDLSCIGSDHCPLLIQTSLDLPQLKPQFRFDPTWVEQEEFVTLVIRWWSEYQLRSTDVAKSWHKKLKFMQKKISGWAKNFYGARKREKKKNSSSTT